MPFDWNNFLVLADELATRVDDEASKRTAISRAYYCMFNLAFARAESTAGPYPGDQSSHNWCWGKYQATPDPTCQQLGNDGQRMKRLRVNADYDTHVPTSIRKFNEYCEKHDSFRQPLQPSTLDILADYRQRPSHNLL